MSDITHYLDTLNKVEILIEVENYKPYKLYALIDTGAQSNIIHPNLYPEERYKEIEKKYFSGLSAGVTCTHMIEEMKIKIFDTRTEMYKPFRVSTVYVIKGSKVDLILGMDFILANIPLVINKDTIKLGNIETIRIKNNFKFYDQDKIYQSINTNKKSWKVDYLAELEELFSDNPLKEFERSPRYMSLKLKADAKPFRMKPLVYNQHDQVEYRKQILEWKNLGLVEKTDSEYMSTSFIVRNHAEITRGKARIVINYKKLNNITEFDGYFIPSIESLIYRIEDNKYFSKFDAKSGFWQIKIKNDLSKALTAFSTPYGHYQWTVMPFGLKNAPQIFQKWMNSIFKDLSFVLVYIDDILVMSKTLEEHIQHLNVVKNKFLRHGIILGKRKIILAETEIEFLGRKIIGGKFELQDHIIKKIKNFPEIKTLKNLQAFVGILNYGRKYFKNLSEILQSLIKKINEVTKAYKETNDKPIRKWDTDKISLTLDEEQLKTIELIKQMLYNIPKVTIPFPEDILSVMTDASDEFWGGIVVMENTSDICGYASGKFRKPELKYMIYEKEFIALHRTIETFKYYLLSRNFIVYVDNRGLYEFLKNKKPEYNENARRVRWILDLEIYSFIIRFKPGYKNEVADFLSRPNGKNNNIQ